MWFCRDAPARRDRGLGRTILRSKGFPVRQGRHRVQGAKRRPAGACHDRFRIPAGYKRSHVLFLRVVEIDPATPEDTDGMTVVDLAGELLGLIENSAPNSIMDYLHRLEVAGLRLEDDYSDHVWRVTRSFVAKVHDGFPCLAAPRIPAGISSVSYSIAMTECGRFATPIDDLRDMITGRSRY